jgi:NTE family protein
MAKAVVLGGGGVAGIAWETGVLLGLADAGLDLTDADLFVGTSAGSVVATQVASGVPLADLYDLQVAGTAAELAVDFDLEAMTSRFVEMLADHPEPEELRRRVGAWALTTDTVPEAERLEVIGSRLPVREWPERALRITAVDAATGTFVVFDSASGVDLVDAVAASCAVPAARSPSHSWATSPARPMVNGVRTTTVP